MGEKQGQRESIEKLQRYLIRENKGRMSPEKAREIARKAAIRQDQRKDGDR